MKPDIFHIENYQFTYPNSKSAIFWQGTIHVKENDRILLSGHSGSGKSTLLYALKGFFPDTIYGKTSGNIRYYQIPIEQLSAKKKLEIGLLFQNPDTQMFHKKVFHELAFGLENMELSALEMKNKIHFLANQFRVSELLERDIHTLSGGEKQKIALLSILMMNPKVLLLDEPTAFLDSESAAEFISAFSQIAQEKTIVIVEHNMQYLSNYVNRNVHLNETGKIAERKLSDVEWNPTFEKIAACECSKPLWHLKNLRFSYQPEKLLLHIKNFTIYQNEILGIMGKNGSGKTTLLSILAGLLRHYDGEITFKSKVQRKLKKRELFKEISLLFQNPENHFLFSTVAKEVEDDFASLARFSMEKYISQSPFSLSEGEKRRLSLAIQLHLQKKIFLMDEPTFGQDSNQRKNLLEIISTARKNGCTFVIISHDKTWLTAACDRIVHLENGELR